MLEVFGPLVTGNCCGAMYKHLASIATSKVRATFSPAERHAFTRFLEQLAARAVEGVAAECSGKQLANIAYGLACLEYYNGQELCAAIEKVSGIKLLAVAMSFISETKAMQLATYPYCPSPQ